MEYSFSFELKIGEVCVACIDGCAFIEPCDSDWNIREVRLEDVGTTETVVLPTGHPLHVPIMTWLLNERRSDIEWEWRTREPEVEEYEPDYEPEIA